MYLFFVDDKPAPKGSWITRTSKKGKTSFRPDNPRTKPFADLLKIRAKESGVKMRESGSVTLSLRFIFERPRAHYRTGKFSHLLRVDAPGEMTKKPDLDKLARNVMDALTGIAYRDDCQVHLLILQKEYVSEAYPAEGVQILIKHG